MQSDHISRVEERVYRHWYEDGFGDLTAGGLFFLFACYFGGHAWLEKGSLTSRLLLDGSLILMLICGIIFMRWLLGVMKTHFTYPRTGYVELNSSKRVMWQRTLTALVGVVGAVLIFLYGKVFGSFGWAPAMLGLLFGIVYLIIAVRAGGLRRYYLLSAFSIILGSGLQFSLLLVAYDLVLFYILLGSASIISGGITLSNFLKEHPIPVESEDD